jgi:predicted Rossmann-fold nucleotide-binding protein
MSELREGRWAVMSERGREATGLAYEDAAELVHRLKGEGLSGLCVITGGAAGHLPPAMKVNRKPSAGNNPKPPARRRKNKPVA